MSAHPYATTFLSIDLIFHGSEGAYGLYEQGYRPVQGLDPVRSTSNGSFRRAVDFLARIAKIGHVKARQTQIGVKLIVPLQTGYVVRSDFLLERLAFCEICDFAESFLDPAQHISAYKQSENHRDDLNKLLDLAIGAVVVKSSVYSSLDMSMEALVEVLSERLHNPWVVPSPSIQAVVAWQC
jgi:hypothetical protein